MRSWIPNARARARNALHRRPPVRERDESDVYSFELESRQRLEQREAPFHSPSLP